MGRYLNPILPGCHPDPSVCRVGEEFYLVTSTFEYLPGLPVHVSRNLVDWTPLGHAIHRPGQLELAGIPSSSGLFAPTIRHHDGRFFVVCTVVGPDDGSWAGRTGHFVVTATDAAGPWSDPVWIDGLGGIDPSLTFDGDRVWLTGTRLAARPQWPGQTEVWLVGLDPQSLQPLSEPVAIWSGALLGAVWAEGPHLFPRPGGGWMLVAAEGGTSLEHAVCVAYADEIGGPYLGDPGNPRLSHRDLGRSAPIAAVGHADLVDDTGGRTWATVLATRSTDGVDGLLGRQTCLVPVGWENRRPVFAPGHGRVLAAVDVDGVADQAPQPTRFHDGFDGPRLDLAWNGVGRQPATFADLTARAGHVRLRAGAEPTTPGAQSFLGRRLPAEHADISAVVELSGAAVPLRGGLLLRTSEQAQLELSIGHDGTARCVITARGRSRTIGEQPGRGPRAELRIELRGLDARATIDGLELATAQLESLVPDPAHGFVGAWVGPFAVADAAGGDGDGDGGHLDVDEVTIELVEPGPRERPAPALTRRPGIARAGG